MKQITTKIHKAMNTKPTIRNHNGKEYRCTEWSYPSRADEEGKVYVGACMIHLKDRGEVNLCLICGLNETMSEEDREWFKDVVYDSLIVRCKARGIDPSAISVIYANETVQSNTDILDGLVADCLKENDYQGVKIERSEDDDADVAED